MQNVVDVSADREQRRRDAESTLASLRIEGLEISPAAQAISDRYVAGEITVDQVVEEILSLY